MNKHRSIQKSSEVDLLSLFVASTLDEICGAVPTICRQILRVYSGAFYLLKDDSFKVAVSWGPGNLVESFHLGQCIAVRRMRVHSNKLASLRCPHLTSLASALCVPISAAGKVIGLLSLKRILSSRVAERRQLFAECLGIALAKLLLHAELEDQAMRDAMTGLFNRRYFDLALEKEIRRARRESTQFAVILMDTDYFKQFNDQNGHPAADAMLRSVTSLLQKQVRDEDTAVRWGGDELALLLVNISVQSAFDRAEKFRQAVLQLRHMAGKTSVSVSIGIAVYPENGDAALDLVIAADQALYRAKARGRNCTEIADALTVSKNATLGYGERERLDVAHIAEDSNNSRKSSLNSARPGQNS